MTPEAIVSEILQHRYRFQREIDLQDGIMQVLVAAKVPFAREHCIDGVQADRVDFMLNDVALEVKTAGSISSVMRQLHRYSQHESVAAIVLVTSRAMHNRMPESFNGKPVHVVYLAGSAF